MSAKLSVEVRAQAQARLYSLFQELNRDCFGSVLPEIPVRFNSRLRNSGGAYRRVRNRLTMALGINSAIRYIDINPRYLSLENCWAEIRDTLGHEMIHYWLDYRGRPCGHTAEFKAKLAAHGWSRYSRLTPVGTRHTYRCPSCTRIYYRRRKGRLSCGPCSGRKFNVAYLLELVESS